MNDPLVRILSIIFEWAQLAFSLKNGKRPTNEVDKKLHAAEIEKQVLSRSCS